MTQHVLLLDMCSLQFRYHLKMLDGMRGTIDLAAIRRDITDYLYDEQSRGKGWCIAALEKAQGGDGEKGDDGEDLSPEATQQLPEKDPTGALLAVINEDFLQNKKGGKGKVKKGAPRTCFERGAKDHLAAVCTRRF